MKSLTFIFVLVLSQFAYSQEIPTLAANSSWQTAQGNLGKTGVQGLGGNIGTPSLKWEFDGDWMCYS